MKHKFFNIPVADPVNAETELNAFIAQHRITHIDRHFVADGANSFWSKHLRQYRYYGKITIAGYFANYYLDGLDRLLAGLPTSPSAIDSMINRGDRSKMRLRPRCARRLLEQQRQERPFRHPQQEHA